MGKIINSWKSSGKGLRIVVSHWQFWAIAIPVTLVFIFIFNLLSSGNNFLQLLIALPFFDKLSVIGQVYLEFLYSLLSLEKFLILLASIGQGVVVAMIAFLWKSRRQFDDKAILESAGASLIALIGAGCPMCGGTILLPILMSIFGAGTFVFLQNISLILMAIAIVIIVFAIKHLGFMCYMQPKKKSQGGKGINEKAQSRDSRSEAAREDINEKS